MAAITLSKTGFPLLAVLYEHAAISGSDDGKSLTFRADVPGIEIDQLVYFATSVIWRASVGKWHLLNRWFGSVNEPDLGEHEESIRLYLLGQAPFPEDAILAANACSSDKPAMVFTYPGSLGREADGAIQFTFNVPGLMFALRLNDHIAGHRIISLVNNPVVPIIQVGPSVWDFLRKWVRTTKIDSADNEASA